jgi:predicted PurR-regulated permease PerM
VQRPREPILENRFIARAARVLVVAWSAVGIVIITTLVLRYVLFPIRIIFPPVLLALILVYLLNPVVSWLGRRRVKRVLATLLTYVVFLTVLGFLLSWLVPLISRQASTFGGSIPDLLRRAERGLIVFSRKLGLRVHTTNLLGAFGKTGSVGEYVRRVTSVSSAVGLALVLVLGPILAFYLLVDLPKLSDTLQAAIPARRRREVLGVARRVSAAVGGYFRGQLLVAALVGAFCMTGFWLVGLPYWALVGLLIGLFSLIPLIGPFLGAIPALFVAFTTPASNGGVLVHPRPGWPLAVAASVVLLIVQQADVLIISPRVVSRNVRLHPVTVMLSLLIAGTIAGVYGMLLAIPAIAAVKIVIVHYWDTRMVWPPRGPEESGAAPAEGSIEAPRSDPGHMMVAVLPEDDPAYEETPAADAEVAAGDGEAAPPVSPAERAAR